MSTTWRKAACYPQIFAVRKARMPPHLADKCLAVRGKRAIFQIECTDIYVVYVKVENFQLLTLRYE